MLGGKLVWGGWKSMSKKNLEVELVGPYLDDVDAIYSDRQNRRVVTYPKGSEKWGDPTQNGRNIQVKDL